MLIGVPREIKDNEFRVGLTPSSVAELVHQGHRVVVEEGAGIGSGLSDAEYESAGASIAADPASIFADADMIVKVKEPLAVERKMLRRGQISSPICISRRTSADGRSCGPPRHMIAYETVTRHRPAACRC